MKPVSKRRDLIAEIVDKKGRLYKKDSRLGQFSRRVYPLVAGWRAIKSLDRSVRWRDEWLKYGAIGYVACVEGYFRLLVADLIDKNPVCRANLKDLRDIQVSIATVAALEDGVASSGELCAHLVTLSGVDDISRSMSNLLGQDFIDLILSTRVSELQPKSTRELFPWILERSMRLFQLRHRFAHELGTKGKVPVRAIEQGMAAAALLVRQTEFSLGEAGFLNP